jgi:hypothetical protein
MFLFELLKMYTMVLSLGKYKIQETLMLGALSRDHTKKKNSIKSQKTQNAGTWN